MAEAWAPVLSTTVNVKRTTAGWLPPFVSVALQVEEREAWLPRAPVRRAGVTVTARVALPELSWALPPETAPLSFQASSGMYPNAQAPLAALEADHQGM